MNGYHPTVLWMRHLRLMIPPSGIVLVGAGDGSSEWMAFLSELHDIKCLLVEADRVKFKLLEGTAARQPTWQICNEVISKDAGPINFHETSLPSENSPIAPEQLLELWPNLKLIQVQERQGITLDQLLNGTVPEINWLLIDCLPAIPMIEGMENSLDLIDVINARVIIPNTVFWPEYANLDLLKDFLESKGFRFMAVDASRHPSIGHALFIREECMGNKGLLQKLAHSQTCIEDLRHKLADADAKIEMCSHARRQLAALAEEKIQAEMAREEKSAHIQAVEKTNAELMARLNLSEEELQKAQVQINAGIVQRNEAQKQLDALAVERDHALKLAAERIARIQSLEKANLELMERTKQTAVSIQVAKDTIHASSLSHYEKSARKYARKGPPPFLLIHSKSLPRSGLHYLKSTFANLLGEQFSFCEWYNEVGCCKKHPCSLLGYGQHAEKSGSFRLRLIKSHDFKHTDPAIPTSKVLQRLVLVRDPLFILTSWFELDQMTKYRAVLLENGINIQKIWLNHEKELQLSAYEIVGSVFVPPTREECKVWLIEKARYIIQFLNDWVVPTFWKPDPFTHVRSYEKIDEYVIDTITPYRDYLSEHSMASLDKFAKSNSKSFVRRLEPYTLNVKCVESYIRENADLFEEIVGHITRGTANLNASHVSNQI